MIHIHLLKEDLETSTASALTLTRPGVVVNLDGSKENEESRTKTHHTEIVFNSCELTPVVEDSSDTVAKDYFYPQQVDTMTPASWKSGHSTLKAR